MRDFVRQTVCFGDRLQTKRRFVVDDGPLDALRPQGGGGANQVDDVPPGIAVAPLSRVGVQQVSVQRVANELVVEEQVVVAHHASARRLENAMNLRHRLPFGATCRRRLRGDTRHQKSFGPWHDFGSQLDVRGERRFDGLEIGVRPQTRELHDPVIRGRCARCFDVVPEEGIGGFFHAQAMVRAFGGVSSRAPGQCLYGCPGRVVPMAGCPAPDGCP